MISLMKSISGARGIRSWEACCAPEAEPTPLEIDPDGYVLDGNADVTIPPDMLAVWQQRFDAVAKKEPECTEQNEAKSKFPASASLGLLRVPEGHAPPRNRYIARAITGILGGVRLRGTLRRPSEAPAGNWASSRSGSTRTGLHLVRPGSIRRSRRVAVVSSGSSSLSSRRPLRAARRR